MPTQLEVYGCPICFVNFEWNKANEAPTFCPNCGEVFSPRNEALEIQVADPGFPVVCDNPELSFALPSGGRKGGFAIGGFNPTMG